MKEVPASSATNELCGWCGHHIACHGRRGHGACRVRHLTESGRAHAEEVERSTRAEDPIVRRRVLQTLFALPGMTKKCFCKRFRKTRPVETEPRP